MNGNSFKEQQLIFLISQPRSGSSLLQQLLLANANINTCPEPWFMLSLISTYKQTNIQQGYNPNFAQVNFTNLLNSLPDGLKNFKEKIRTIALDIYGTQINTNTSFFLDKTPRYYHIVDELYELFPKAKYIFLVRNPIAVFSSILSYNFKGELSHMFSPDRIDDLYLAPQVIAKQKTSHNDNAIFVNYENIVNNTVEELTKILEYLELDPTSISNNYKLDNDFKHSNAIDKKSLHEHAEAVTKYLDSWKKTLDSKHKRQIAYEYIMTHDSDTLTKLGYNKKEMLNSIDFKYNYFSKYKLGISYYLQKNKRLNLKKEFKYFIQSKIT